VREKAAEPAKENLETTDPTVLDLVDNLLNKGVVLSGDVVLGIAGVDLIYLRLSAILCGVDRLLPEAERRR
jgi:Gas vesicle protein